MSRCFRIAAGALACSIVIATAAPVMAAYIIGRATYIEDDTFDVAMPNQTVRMRLCGADSPERGLPGYHHGIAPGPSPSLSSYIELMVM